MAFRMQGSLAEVVLGLVATSGHSPLALTLQLRATSHYLCGALTGHFPHTLIYDAGCKEGRVQVGIAVFI